MKVLTQMFITSLGDRVTTKLVSGRHGTEEHITLEMAQPQTFEFESVKPRSTKQDRQKNWPSGGSR